MIKIIKIIASAALTASILIPALLVGYIYAIHLYALKIANMIGKLDDTNGVPDKAEG